MESLDKPITSEQTREDWNAYSSAYSQYEEDQTSVFFLMLANMLKIDNAASVLELACGSGVSLKFVYGILGFKGKYTCADISDSMVELTFDRICRMTKTNPPKPKTFELPFEFPSFSTTLVRADNLDLSLFPNSSFDVYISSFSLMLVENPKIMLSEAMRVLKVGGRIGVSVWGREGMTTYFSIFPRVLKSIGISIPDRGSRSNFHLSNSQHTISLFKEVGFTNIKSWYTANPIPFEEELLPIFLQSPGLGDFLKSLGDSKLEEIKNAFSAEICSMRLRNEVLIFEGLCIIASKE